MQTVFRFGTNEMKNTILDELKGKIVDLSKGIYSSKTIIAFLRYGDDKQRAKVLNEFRNQVRRLSTHNCGSSVLDFAFSYCNVDSSNVGSKKKRRKPTTTDDNEVISAKTTITSILSKLHLELYGADFMLFSSEQHNSKDSKKKAFSAL